MDPTGREIASPGCSSDPDSPACGDCVIDEFDPEWIPICVVDPVPPIIAPPTGGGGGGGEGGEDFVPVSDAQADLNKASCYKLLGFTSATAAQNFFNSISFYYAPFKLTLKNGVPRPLPAPATTSGYGQVNINTSYNWSNFSKVTTSTGGTFNYLAYINGIWHTNLSSEQLGTEIVIHELEHNIKGMNSRHRRGEYCYRQRLHKTPMKVNRISLFLMAGLLISLANSAKGASDYCAFEVKVTDPSGAPLAGIPVAMIQQDDKEFGREVRTDHDGRARLCDAPMQQVSIIVGLDICGAVAVKAVRASWPATERLFITYEPKGCGSLRGVGLVHDPSQITR